MEDLSCGHCHMITLCAECVCLGVFKREAEACQSDETDSGNQNDMQPKASAAGWNLLTWAGWRLRAPVVVFRWNGEE